jgi:hypothetical protein
MTITIRHMSTWSIRAKRLQDFHGNILEGDLQSRTAVKPVRQWIDFRYAELLEDWELARQGNEIKNIEPLQ